MTHWRLKAILEVEESPESLATAYAREVRWAQGFRVNLDSRLMLLGMRRLLTRHIVSETELRSSAFVLGCRLGAMDSYETFDDGMAQGQKMPLAFAYALPSMPLACASICHSLRGITYTVTGGDDVGVRAWNQAAVLIESGAASRVVTGCWESPSATAGEVQSSCRLLLLVLETIAGNDAHALYADNTTSSVTQREYTLGSLAKNDVVATLKQFLVHNGVSTRKEICHV